MHPSLYEWDLKALIFSQYNPWSTYINLKKLFIAIYSDPKIKKANFFGFFRKILGSNGFPRKIFHNPHNSNMMCEALSTINNFLFSIVSIENFGTDEV